MLFVFSLFLKKNLSDSGSSETSNSRNDRVLDRQKDVDHCVSPRSRDGLCCPLTIEVVNVGLVPTLSRPCVPIQSLSVYSFNYDPSRSHTCPSGVMWYPCA